MSFEEEEDCCKSYTFSRDDIDAVNVANWYGLFKHLSPRTILLPIPPEVLKYLKSDGMVMPQNTHTTAHLNYGTSLPSEEKEEDDGEESWASVSENEEEPAIPSEFLQQLTQEQRNQRRGGSGVEEEDVWERGSNKSSSDEGEAGGGVGYQQQRKSMEVEKFHEFDSVLETSIKKLGGAVVAKINRKSPKDAIWIAFNRSLKCYNPGDIYLLLKTSDIVSQLLENPYKDCSLDADEGVLRTTSTSPYYLVLKEWEDSWGPDMEFRCFICANQLVAICQRDLDTCYSSVVNRKDKLLLNIQNFYVKNIQQKFPVDYYTMDIVCHPNGEIYVVDFDVYGLATDPLLFTYQELDSILEEMGVVVKKSRNASNENNKEEDMSLALSRRRLTAGEPCIRFLTESRNFRARKTTRQSELAKDVMTYMREVVSRK